MKLEHSNETKKKQLLTIIGGAVGLVALLIFGLWFSDPNAGKPSARDLARERALEVRKTFRTKDAVSDEETWMAKSEETMQQQTDRIKQMSQILRVIQDSLEARGIDVRVATGDNQAPTPTPLPQEDLPPSLTLGGTPASPDPPTEDPFAAFLPAPDPPGAIPVPPADSMPPPAPLTPPGAAASPTLPVPYQPLRERTPLGGPKSEPREPQIQVVTLGPTDQATGKPTSPHNAKSYLPAGSFLTVRLLSGLDAPTGDTGEQDPIPVLLRVMTDGTLPNFFHSNISSCHIVGSSWGDLASERATIQLNTLACVLLNGDIIETNIKGYVAGEDGKHGFRGRLVSKQGSLVARALLSGLASGFGNALQQQSQTLLTAPGGVQTTIQPGRILQAGAGGGVSNAMTAISQYYLERAQDIFPIIEISANREGDAILQAGVELDLPILDNTRAEEEGS